MKRDGLTKQEAEEDLKRVRAEFDPISDDPDTVLAYEFGLNFCGCFYSFNPTIPVLNSG